MITQYTTIAQNETQKSAEHIVNKSRFVGECFFVETDEQAKSKIEEIRKKNWDATHNCFAYIVSTDAQIARFSDDGEPSQTAGAPILEAIRAKNLTNILVVITRYFGGVLLGTGGLVRAYAKAATMAIDACKIVELHLAEPVCFKIEYTLWGKVQARLQTIINYACVDKIDFSDCVECMIFVKTSKVDEFKKNMVEWCNGQVDFHQSEKPRFYEYNVT